MQVPNLTPLQLASNDWNNIHQFIIFPFPVVQGAPNQKQTCLKATNYDALRNVYREKKIRIKRSGIPFFRGQSSASGVTSPSLPGQQIRANIVLREWIQMRR